MEIIDKVLALRKSLTASFVQKDAEVSAVLAGLFSGEPVFLCGTPGTAKTAIIERVAKSINANYFYYLLTKFTEPEEILGPIDVIALRQGQYKRITEYRLPWAHIAFLDEIFKASSAIRNILLDIILNKRFMNGNGYVKLDLLGFYTASNEISTDSEDQAFYDRLTIRCFVRNVGMDVWNELIDAGISLENNNIEPILTTKEVKELQKIVNIRFQNIRGNQKLKNKYISALSALKNNGIEISDRRKIKVLRVAAALSVVFMDADITLDSLADALRFTAVHTEEDIATVEKVIIQEKLSSFAVQMQKLQTV
ncbi:AAA family ATPase, partial [Candidatus Shapirobacteria bacterium]